MSNDWPFSVTSKFTVDTGAEHLVTIRAATAADMKTRLQEASSIFPYAALITVLEQETAQAQPEVTPAATTQAVQGRGNGAAPTDYPGRPINPRHFPPPNGNGNGQRSPAAAAVAGQTQRANQRSTQARVDRRAALPHLCPEHGRARPSAWGGYHCPTKLPDGSYCKWHWQAPEPANAQVHPRDEN